MKDQFPAGGVVTNLTDWVSAGVGKIPAGTFCKWYDDADNGGKKVVCYTAAQIKAASGTITERRYDYITYQDTYFKFVPYLAGVLVLELIADIRETVKVRNKHGKKREKHQTK